MARPRVDDAARRVDVQADVLLRVLGLEEEQLRDDEVRDVVLDRVAQEDDPFLEQARVDVVGALASAGGLDDHRHEHGLTPWCDCGCGGWWLVSPRRRALSRSRSAASAFCLGRRGRRPRGRRLRRQHRSLPLGQLRRPLLRPLRHPRRAAAADAPGCAASHSSTSCSTVWRPAQRAADEVSARAPIRSTRGAACCRA